MDTLEQADGATEPRRRRGHTLLELAAVLLIGSVALAVGLPGVRARQDTWATQGAREAVASMVLAARREGIARGSAELHIDPEGDRIWVEAAGLRIAELDLADEFDVDLGPAGPVRILRFGPLGVGWVASATLVLKRGKGPAGLSLSSYGRVRRW